MKMWVAGIAAGVATLGVGASMLMQQNDLVRHGSFVLGDDDKPAPALIVGVGDSVERLVQRNPFLKPLGLRTDQTLRLPLMRTTDVTYDDGHWRLHIGCVMTSNLDGFERFSGVEYVGLRLCERFTNDWPAAMRRASELIAEFRKQNPQARDLAGWLPTAPHEELESIFGGSWRNYSEKMMSDAELHAHFERLSRMTEDEGRYAGLSLSKKRGVFLGDRVYFSIGIVPLVSLRGDDLTEAERAARDYMVTMGFGLRKDVPPP
jgi:hypothetical protein